MTCGGDGSLTAAETVLLAAGDEVITSVYTNTATASVICHAGATPVLCDTTKNSFFMELRTTRWKFADEWV